MLRLKFDRKSLAQPRRVAFGIAHHLVEDRLIFHPHRPDPESRLAGKLQGAEETFGYFTVVPEGKEEQPFPGFPKGLAVYPGKTSFGEYLAYLRRLFKALGEDGKPLTLVQRMRQFLAEQVLRLHLGAIRAKGLEEARYSFIDPAKHPPLRRLEDLGGAELIFLKGGQATQEAPGRVPREALEGLREFWEQFLPRFIPYLKCPYCTKMYLFRDDVEVGRVVETYLYHLFTEHYDRTKAFIAHGWDVLVYAVVRKVAEDLARLGLGEVQGDA